MRYIFLLLILILPYNIFGQDQNQLKDIKDLYIKTNYNPVDIKQGKEYLSYYYRSNTTPLLFDGREFNAIIFFDGRKYKNIKLQYDTFTDEVIYTDTSRLINNQFPKIALNKNLLKEFSFLAGYDSLKFRYFKFSELPGGTLKDGFYEVVYEEKSVALIRHKSVEYKYQAVNEYKYSPEMYVSAGDNFVRVKNNKDILRALKNHTQEIKQMMSESKIKIRNNDKPQVIRILKYYDSLAQSDTDLK